MVVNMGQMDGTGRYPKKRQSFPSSSGLLVFLRCVIRDE